MNHENLQELVGKTISKVDTSAVNCVYLAFTDGTSIVLDTEAEGYGLYGICGCDPKNYGDFYVK